MVPVSVHVLRVHGCAGEATPHPHKNCPHGRRAQRHLSAAPGGVARLRCCVCDVGAHFQPPPAPVPRKGAPAARALSRENSAALHKNYLPVFVALVHPCRHLQVPRWPGPSRLTTRPSRLAGSQSFYVHVRSYGCYYHAVLPTTSTRYPACSTALYLPKCLQHTTLSQYGS